MNKILIIIFLFSSSIFAANFEFSFGASAGPSIDFSYNNSSLDSSDDGFKIDAGLTANALLSIGANFEVPTNEIVRTVSALLEIGYNFYRRERGGLSDDDNVRTYYYHSITLGAIAKFNMDNDLSIGLGAGIFIPVYGESDDPYLGNYWGNSGKRFPYYRISIVYKAPVMPYIKASFERSLYFSEKWAVKLGGNLIYNFGMEANGDKLAKIYTQSDFSGKHTFSSLGIELLASISFGRPK